MRAIVWVLVLAGAAAPARADAPPPPPPPEHATGPYLEARYSPESDLQQMPVTSHALIVGYLGERLAVGGVFGIARATLDQSFSGSGSTTFSNTETLLTFGITARGQLLSTRDHATDLVGEASLTLTDIWDSSSGGSAQSEPTPFRIELGIGPRHWLVPQLALGASILARYTYTSQGMQSMTQLSVGGAVYLSGVL